MALRPQTLYGLTDSPVVPGGVHARPRPGEPGDDHSLLRRAAGRPEPRRRPGQHHAVLADEDGGLRLAAVRGVQVQLLRRQERHRPGRRERLPGRDLHRRRAAGPSRRTPTSSTTTRSTGAGTSPPGSSRSCTPPSCATGSARFARSTRPDRMPSLSGATSGSTPPPLTTAGPPARLVAGGFHERGAVMSDARGRKAVAGIPGSSKSTTSPVRTAKTKSTRSTTADGAGTTSGGSRAAAPTSWGSTPPCGWRWAGSW